MCFGFKSSSQKGTPENGTDVPVPARKVSSPVDGATAGTETLIEKPKKKGWRDDEYGDSMSLTIHARTQKRIKELYPDGVPKDAEGMTRSQM
ncbi:hypothetical protein V495_04331, partial [Pseudogymnoascus sp. VKM F-4514 (FW-929)]